MPIQRAASALTFCQGSKGAVTAFAFQYDSNETKRLLCNLCVCIPVSQIHSIAYRSMAIEEQNSLGRGASGKNLLKCLKQIIFKKRPSLKFFLFFIGLVWKKVFIFRFAGLFSKFLEYVPGLSG